MKEGGIHNGWDKHLASLLVHQVEGPGFNGEAQKGHGVGIRVEEYVGMWAGITRMYMFLNKF